MLEHTAVYLSGPQLCDEGETFPDLDLDLDLDLYSRLGPCDLQDRVWTKMSVVAPVNKKRKKSETKHQSQIIKCENEKRRREQENIYIEELAELISANFSDMSSISVKPDKCAILQETVNQIRSIKQRESGGPVQQGEVSSSKPTVITNEIYGPLLLEALEGFLFVVNAEGKVEHVTDNVLTYIRFTKDEVYGRSIYNFIHHGDHARFSSLLPTVAWPGDPEPAAAAAAVGSPISNRRSFSVRFLVKSDDGDAALDEKPHQAGRISQYDSMHISSTQLRHLDDDDAGDGGATGPRLLCVASRITYREKALNASMLEQFTTKLDTSGRIIGIDVSSVTQQYTQFLNKDLLGTVLQELCAPQDQHKLVQHLKDTLSAGQATSPVYLLRAGADKYVQVHTKSKLFKPSPPIGSGFDTEFIMATHSILSDDSSGPSDPGGGGGGGCLGGPLMTSVVNGTTRNGSASTPVSSGSDSSTPFGSDAPYIEMFKEVYPTSTWDLDCMPVLEPRPDSRQSVATPVSISTPRPPSASAFSPAGPVPHSPLTPFPQASPYSQRAAMDGTPEEKHDTKAEESSVVGIGATSQMRARNTSAQCTDQILKTLLEGNDDDSPKPNRPKSRVTQAPAHRTALPGTSATSELPKAPSGGKLAEMLSVKNIGKDEDKSMVANQRDDLLDKLGYGKINEGEHSNSTGSNICKKNQMLVKMLSEPPSDLPVHPSVPASVLSATPHDTLPRVTAAPSVRPAVRSAGSQNSALNPHASQSPMNMRRQPSRPPNSTTSCLNTMLSSGTLSQRTASQQMSNHAGMPYGASAATSSTDSSYYEGVDVVSSMVEIVYNLESVAVPQTIDEIQKSLMECETVVRSPSSPTIALPPGVTHAFNTHAMDNSNSAYAPPPKYSRIANLQRAQIRPGSGQYPIANPQQLLQQQRKSIQDKMRLLERQCDQQFVIPSNAVDASGIQNIDNLLNNTVAPNVSLQRSSEPQQSPSYQLNQQSQRIGPNQQPYSPHSQMTSPIGPQANFTQGSPASFQQTGARLSPHPPFNQQLSPRQSYPPATAQNASWQQPATGRLSVQQQQNPLLNAQLTGSFVPSSSGCNYPVQRNPQPQARATGGSPGSSSGTRHSPFAAETFQTPASPNSPYSQSYMRLPRNNSAPAATMQLPGGLAASRQFGRDLPPSHSYSQLPPTHHHTMMYQQEPSYSYDQTGLQLPYNGADRGRLAPHLQAGVSGAGNAGTTSDYVRQELRAVVGARAGQQQQQQMTNSTRPQLQQQQMLAQNTPDLDALGLSFEMPPSAGASDSPKLWGAMGSEMGSMSPPQTAISRTTMEEGRQGDQNPSLLQKLLSE